MKVFTILASLFLSLGAMAQSGAGVPPGSTGGTTNSNVYRTPEQQRMLNQSQQDVREPGYDSRRSQYSPDETNRAGSTPAGGNVNTLGTERIEIR